MKRFLCVLFVLCLMLPCLTAVGERENPLAGAWKCLSLTGTDGEEIDFPSLDQLGLLLTLRFEESGTMDILACAREEKTELEAEYALFEPDTLFVRADQEFTLKYEIEGNILTLREEAENGDAMTGRFILCEESALLGSWRSVLMSMNGTQINTDGSQTVGMDLSFREGGMCTGVIKSSSGADVREMRYVAAGGVLTLIEPDAVSNLTYTLEGDTLICTLSEDGTFVTFTLIKSE